MNVKETGSRQTGEVTEKVRSLGFGVSAPLGSPFLWNWRTSMRDSTPGHKSLWRRAWSKEGQQPAGKHHLVM